MLNGAILRGWLNGGFPVTCPRVFRERGVVLESSPVPLLIESQASQANGNRAHQPIGIFDSGVGGLTVLKAIAQRLPQESILYLGDTARLPYGTRSPAEILQFVRDIIGWMEQQRVKAVVMACNTSSALALDAVRHEFGLPMLGMITPTVQAAASGQRVGVIATPATASSRAYSQAIQAANPTTRVWEVGCPEFVPLIEQNQIYCPTTQPIVARYLHALLAHQIDTLIYGCTHYPHLKPVVNRLLPASVRQIDPAVHVAEAIATQLAHLNLLSTDVDSSPHVRFCVSDRPERFAALAAQWLGEVPVVDQVGITSSEPATSGAGRAESQSKTWLGPGLSGWESPSDSQHPSSFAQERAIAIDQQTGQSGAIASHDVSQIGLSA